MAFTLIPLLGSFSLEWHGQDSVIQLKPPYSSVLYQWFCWRQEHMYSYYGFKCISGCTSHLVFLFQYIHTCIHTYICIIYILSCLTWTRAVGVLSLGADFRPQLDCSEECMEVRCEGTGREEVLASPGCVLRPSALPCFRLCLFSFSPSL